MARRGYYYSSSSAAATTCSSGTGIAAGADAGADAAAIGATTALADIGAGCALGVLTVSVIAGDSVAVLRISGLRTVGAGASGLGRGFALASDLRLGSACMVIQR